MNHQKKYSVGIVGVRGYVGMELVKIINLHPNLELAWLSSRQLKNKSINEVADVKLNSDIKIESLSPTEIASRQTDIVVLALPNLVAQPFVSCLLEVNKNQLIIDLSADYRFDSDWIYSIPELHTIKKGKKQLSKPILLSNPGCYATAMQLAIAPVADLVVGRPNCFGISGY
ncbi:MAG: N-acetyl-gamma-glutamyl-phosphate reductase, partial [Kangiellaceae bacterium]|nr:N-acetyl-gamma-glutamyl-phosphate reductase [Kangiellaceae bacterium]